MRIALVEDEEAQRLSFKSLLDQVSELSGTAAELTLFDSAGAFLFAWPERQFDGVFLDIQMPGQTGMDLARKIRIQDQALPLIFLTGLRDYALEGYQVEALRYLIKPVSDIQLRECLELLQQRSDRQAPSLIVEDGRSLRRIRFEDIWIVEAQGHDTLFYLNQEQWLCRQGISSLVKQLPCPPFFQCHRSLLIHIGHIQRIGRSEIVMENGKCVPLARFRRDEAQKAFIRYHRGLDAWPQ